MPGRSEKARRSVIKQGIKAAEKNEIFSKLPVSIEMVEKLFYWLQVCLTDNACNNTLKFTDQFLSRLMPCREKNFEFG